MKISDEHIERALHRRPALRPAPEDLTADVMRRVSNDSHHRSVPSHSLPLLTWFRPLLAGATLVLIALGWLLQLEPASPVTHPPGNSASATPPPEFQLPEIPAPALAALPQRIDDPLQKELQHLVSDARNAVNYLAANFLPSDSLPTE